MKSNTSAIVPLILGAGHAARNMASSAGALITKSIFIPKSSLTFTNGERRWDAEKYISANHVYLQRLDRVYLQLLRAASSNRYSCELDISNTFDDAADHYIYVKDPKFYRTHASGLAPECHAGETCVLLLTVACVLSVVRYTDIRKIDVLYMPERVNERILEFVTTLITALNGLEYTQDAAVTLVTWDAFINQVKR